MGDDLNKRCCTIADQIVPKYRGGDRSYGCGSYTAKQWGAAYAAARLCLVAKDVAITDEMAERALHAWFIVGAPSKTDQGLMRSMKAALAAGLDVQPTATIDIDQIALEAITAIDALPHTRHPTQRKAQAQIIIRNALARARSAL